MARIGILTPNPELAASGRSFGGVDRFTVLMGQILQRLGHTVGIIGPRGGWSFLPSPLAALQPWDEVGAGKLDLVIANSPFGLTVPRNIPLISLAHGIFAGSARVAEATVRERVWRRVAATIEARSCRRADQVVAVSELVKRMIALYYGREDATVILNGVDTDFWSRSEIPLTLSTMPVCLFVGTPRTSKGFHLFLSLARKLSGHARFISVLSSEWDARPASYVEVQSALNENRLKEFYCKADLLLFPSSFEGCPYVLIESWSCALPSLTTAVGHVPELAERHSWLRDFVVPSLDETKWLHAVERMLKQLAEPGSRRELGMKFRMLALEHHSLAKWKDQWSQTIQSYLS